MGWLEKRTGGGAGGGGGGSIARDGDTANNTPRTSILYKLKTSTGAGAFAGRDSTQIQGSKDESRKGIRVKDIAPVKTSDP